MKFLGKCDALITDYSSVFIDFLLTKKPIGFIVNDFDDYNKINGFSLENPKEFMPGEYLNQIQDLNIFLENLIKEKDNYLFKRISVSNYFNQYEQENNCKNILDWMDIKKEN